MLESMLFHKKSETLLQEINFNFLFHRSALQHQLNWKMSSYKTLKANLKYLIAIIRSFKLSQSHDILLLN